MAVGRVAAAAVAEASTGEQPRARHDTRPKQVIQLQGEILR